MIEPIGARDAVASPTAKAEAGGDTDDLTPDSLYRCSTSSASSLASSTPSASRRIRCFNGGRATAETVAATLSSYATPAAQLLQFPPSRPQLVAPAPHLLQGRAYRGRHQPALSDHQPRRSRFRGVCFFTTIAASARTVLRSLKNGFCADRLSCHRFLANAFRLLLHGFAYYLVNLFRLQLPQALALGADRNSARTPVQTRGPRAPDHPLHSYPPGYRTAFSISLPRSRAGLQYRLTCSGSPNVLTASSPAERCPKNARPRPMRVFRLPNGLRLCCRDSVRPEEPVRERQTDNPLALMNKAG